MLYSALVVPVCLGGSALLVLYAAIIRYVRLTAPHYVPHYWRNLVRFTYSVLCTVGVAWFVLLSLFVFTDVESGPWVWGTLEWREYPAALKNWLWLWGVCLLPGIPGLLLGGETFADMLAWKRYVTAASDPLPALRASIHTVPDRQPPSGLVRAVVVLITYVFVLTSIATRTM